MPPPTPARLGRPAHAEPEYLRVAKRLRARLQAGHYQPGSFLPPLRQLASEYGVGLTVARLAVNELKSEQWIVPTGRGRLAVVQPGGAGLSPEHTVLEVLSNLLERYCKSPYGRSLQQGIETGVSRIFSPLTILQDSYYRDHLPLPFLHGPLRGIVLVGAVRRELLEHYEKLRVRVVLLDQAAAGKRISSISVDNEHGARDATRRLIALGHRRIAFMRMVLTNLGGVDPDSQERQRGYERALREAGIPLRKEWVFNVMTTGPAMGRLLRTRPAITAVLAHSAGFLIPLIEACQEAGRRVPEDLSLAGFEALDSPHAHLSGPRVDFFEMGLRAVLLLKQPGPPVHLRMPTIWYAGRTVAPVKR